MLDVVQSESFARWLGKLKDRQVVARINARIRCLSKSGSFGDAKPAREGVSEMRIDYGPGYRLYFMQRGTVLVVLLAGGDKSTQDADIKRAIAVSKEWKEQAWLRNSPAGTPPITSKPRKTWPSILMHAWRRMPVTVP